MQTRVDEDEELVEIDEIEDDGSDGSVSPAEQREGSHSKP